MVSCAKEGQGWKEIEDYGDEQLQCHGKAVRMLEMGKRYKRRQHRVKKQGGQKL